MEKKAFLFAGQGVQTVGMAQELQTHCAAQKIFTLAEQICPEVLKCMWEGPQERLNQTIYTQPAIFLADLASAYVEAEKNGMPDALLGFSVGEIPALCFSGFFSVEDGLKIILKRASLMEAYANRVAGCMVAVLGLAAADIVALCDGVHTHPANFNGAKQTVVACKKEYLPTFLALVKEKGGRAMQLKVSGMFHCPELQKEAKEFEDFLTTITWKKGKIPVYANVTALPYQEGCISLLAKQMCSPVRFTDSITNMRLDGIGNFVEVGPGKVLTGLVAKG